MVRHLRGSAIALLAALLVAGCAGPDSAPADGGATDAPEDGGAAPAAFEHPFDHSGCRAIEVITTMPPARVAPYVPDDFDVPENPLVIVGANVCGAEGAAVGRGFVAIQVTPADPALRSPRAVNYFWEPEMYSVAGTALAEAYELARGNQTLAKVTVATTPTSSGFTITAGDVGYGFSAMLTGPPGASAAANALMPFREYSAAAGGYAYLDAAFSGGEGAAGFFPGTLTVEGETVGAALFGASSTQVGGMLADIGYEDARVGFVPWP